ncbi:MAG TPA: hypothetical protein VLH39_05765, partial [Magnetospirillaceae bacterium]|nr:hypothetical protein [Magnetospirillaceae bacterium]
MKKVILVMPDRGRSAALKILRRIGVVHADPIAGRGQAWDAASADLARIEGAAGILFSFKAKGTAPALGYTDSIVFASKVLEAAESIKAGQERLSAIRKEIDRIQGWGDFDPAVLAYLRGKGMDLRLYEATPKAAGVFPADLPRIRVASDGRKERYAGFLGGAVALPEGAEEFAPPQASLSALRDEEKSLIASMEALKAFLTEAAVSLPSLAAARERARSNLQFEALLSGMEGEGPVVWVSGWVPVRDAPRLAEAADSRGWGLLLDDPADDELPPTKVENRPVVRLIAPVFDFLGTVPHYREYDVSASFLVFLTIFFAMIFGDGGYGSILLVIGVFSAFKARRSGKPVPDPV